MREHVPDTGCDDVDLRQHALHGMRWTGADKVLGRWHRDRMSAKGYGLEARVFLRSLMTRLQTLERGRQSGRFLMLGRPRSGTTLLARLLNQVDGIRCDGEVLHHAVAFPRGLLNRLAYKSREQVYGAKLITYQIAEVQGIHDAEAFLRGLCDDGFRLIHIRRRTFDQALSLSVAQATHRYHIRKHAPVGVGIAALSLDPERWLHQIRWNMAMLDYEDRLMARFAHLRVDYEPDLADPAMHQHSVDRICLWLGVASSPVTADLDPTGARSIVTNLDTLRQAVTSGGFARLLTEPVAGAVEGDATCIRSGPQGAA